jgi:GNAT superfamily N-acetyltransferase
MSPGNVASKSGVPQLRLARLDEAEGIDALMKDSTRELFPLFYDAAQTTSSIRFIASVDRMLIQDGTYFVIEAGGELVACGGWSRRDKLYTGSGDAAGNSRVLDPGTESARVRAMFVRADWTRRGLGTRILEACEAAARAEGYRTLALMATLPGEPLYARYGFSEVERADITMPDGCTIGGVRMTKVIDWSTHERH